jgi:hypothetical protein
MGGLLVGGQYGLHQGSQGQQGPRRDRPQRTWRGRRPGWGIQIGRGAWRQPPRPGRQPDDDMAGQPRAAVGDEREGLADEWVGGVDDGDLTTHRV